MRINNWMITVKPQILIGISIMWFAIFLYAGASLYALGIYEKSMGLISSSVVLGILGALIASLDIKPVENI